MTTSNTYNSGITNSFSCRNIAESNLLNAPLKTAQSLSMNMNTSYNSLDSVTNSLMGKKIIERLSEQYLKVDCINKNLKLENIELKAGLESTLNKLKETDLKLNYLLSNLPNNFLVNEQCWPNILSVTELKDTIYCAEKGLSNLRRLLEDKLEKSLSNQCVICQSTIKNCLLIPCSHISSCFNCSTTLLKCPICRSKINQCVKVYLS